MLQIFLESVFVGLYSLLLYYLFLHKSKFVSNFFNQLFIIGFFKHLLGYFFIHRYYCQFGYACKDNNYLSVKSNKYILIESIGEGLIYVIFGMILIKYTNTIVTMFMIGFLLHLIFEIIGVHKKYCQQRCK